MVDEGDGEAEAADPAADDGKGDWLGRVGACHWLWGLEARLFPVKC